MQKRVISRHQRRLPKPALRCLSTQHITQRHQGHALVVCHVVFNNAERLGMRLACSGKVNGIHEAVLSSSIEQFHAAQVGNGIFGS